VSVEVNGDNATATITYDDDGEKRAFPVQLRRQDGHWKLHIPFNPYEAIK
jgi:hypothetical protein